MPNEITEPVVPPEIPEWFTWDEQRVNEVVEEQQLCNYCDSTYVFRYVSTGSHLLEHLGEAFTEREWVRTNNLGTSRNTYRSGDILVPIDLLDGIDYCTSPHFDMRYSNIGESYDVLCDSCQDNRNEAESEARYSDDDDEPESPYVHSYTHRPRVIFFEKLDASNEVVRSHNILNELGHAGKCSPASSNGSYGIQKPFCGFELEMSDEDGRMPFREAAEYLNDACGQFAYMKHDGSVSNGFELVTHPHTLSAYQQRMPMWNAIDLLRSRGWRSWSSSSSCGLHIHINNASFVDVGHAMRFLKFIYSNKSPLVAFAGRDSSYARFDFEQFVTREIHAGWHDDGSMKFETQNLSHVVKKQQVNQGRYLAVNAQNDNTYELRFFRGSMRPKTVLACLEFTYALHEYTQGLTSHDCVAKRALTWRSFLAFVRNKSGSEDFAYRNLLTRLTQARRNPDTGFLGLSDES